MQGLNVIAAQNNEAAERALQAFKGKHIVAEYSGLHAISYEAFSTLEEAQRRVDELNATGGSVSGKLHNFEG